MKFPVFYSWIFLVGYYRVRLWHLTTSEASAVGLVMKNKPRNRHLFIYIWIIEESGNLSANGRQVEQTKSTWETSSQKEYFLTRTETHAPHSSHHGEGLQSPLGICETGAESSVKQLQGPKATLTLRKGGGNGPKTVAGVTVCFCVGSEWLSWGRNSCITQREVSSPSLSPKVMLILVFGVFVCCWRGFPFQSSRWLWKTSTREGHSHFGSTLVLVCQKGVKHLLLSYKKNWIRQDMYLLWDYRQGTVFLTLGDIKTNSTEAYNRERESGCACRQPHRQAVGEKWCYETKDEGLEKYEGEFIPNDNERELMFLEEMTF